MDEFRKEIKKKRDSFFENSKSEHKEKSQLIGEEIYSMIVKQEPEAVLAFRALGSEVDLDFLYDRLLKQGYDIYFPVTKKEGIFFYRVESLEDCEEGKFGVREPKLQTDDLLYRKSDVAEKTFCITPGLVFDEMGNRKGYGGGYYDRFFATNPSVYKVGVGFDFQKIEKLEKEAWDVPLDRIVIA